MQPFLLCCRETPRHFLIVKSTRKNQGPALEHSQGTGERMALKPSDVPLSDVFTDQLDGSLHVFKRGCDRRQESEKEKGDRQPKNDGGDATAARPGWNRGEIGLVKKDQGYGDALEEHLQLPDGRGPEGDASRLQKAPQARDEKLSKYDHHRKPRLNQPGRHSDQHDKAAADDDLVGKRIGNATEGGDKPPLSRQV